MPLPKSTSSSPNVSEIAFKSLCSAQYIKTSRNVLLVVAERSTVVGICIGLLLFLLEQIASSLLES